jgi:hypothetical protein
MEYILEKQRKTKITAECDVLVAGGGIAGNRRGGRGGPERRAGHTAERELRWAVWPRYGLITIYLPLCDGRGTQVSFGLCEELLRLSIKHGAEQNYPAAWLDGGTHEERVQKRFMTQFNPHLLAIEAEKLLLGLGVQILYGTLAAGTAVDTAA